MPANLTPEYLAAEKKYKAARTPEEKIACLREMLAVIPKHKGTDHLQGDIKRRLAQLRKEGMTRKGGPKRAVSPYVISRAGAGQVVVIGPPNSGKSSLVGAVTNASVEVAAYPFSTTVPVPGMMIFDTIRIQLIDTPPLMTGDCDPELIQLLGRADLAVLVLSVADPGVLEQFEGVERELREHQIELVREPESAEEVRMIGGAVTTVVVATGGDSPDGPEGIELLTDLVGDRLPVTGVVPRSGEGLDDFRWEVWRRLRCVRVFTKEPGKKPDLADPFFLSEGETVLDLAFRIHKDLARDLKFARLWGTGVHDGQAVPRDHVLHDRDVVELHVR